MFILKNQTRRRQVPGSLGAAQRSIGYLQGGYKDSTVHSSVQLFSTVTQSGSIVYDTGYQRNYRPGMSGNHAGYFSRDDATNFNKFSYITASAASSFSVPEYTSTTASDFDVYTAGWVVCSASAGWGPSPVTNWYRVDFVTDTPQNMGSLSTAPHGTTRQALSTSLAGFFDNVVDGYLTSLNFTNFSTATSASITQLQQGIIQIPTGMSHTNSVGYFAGYNGTNIRVGISTDIVTSLTVTTSYTYHFGESHSVSSSSAGYMMAGYQDTTGRYGGTQHALCQKMSFADESITTLPDLVLAQSSGQMMQGF